jgi:cytochrome c553
VKKFFKWTGFIVAGIVGLVMLTLAAAYVISWRHFSKHYAAATPPALDIPTDAASIAAGMHLASVHGCIGCHGPHLEGTVLYDVPHVIRGVAPNISGGAGKFSTAQLITVVRLGIRHDGTSAWLMPSVSLRNLNDGDLARILAFVRSVPARDGIHEATDFRIGGRLYVAFGGIEAHGEAEQVATFPAQPVADLKDSASRGHYLVVTTCIECHGQQLEGSPIRQSPPLIVVKGYSREDFGKLMHTGVALGGRELGMMREVALARFASYTEQEIDDLYAYLHSRG